MSPDLEQRLVSELKQYVTENLPLSKISDEELEERIEDIVEQRLAGQYCSIEQRLSIVRQIYTLFMQGKTLNWITKHLTEQGHPAIIDPDQWEKVQTEMAVRKSKGRHHNSLSPFSAKIVCGDCGEYYGPKVWHSTDKYRRVIWQCNGKS